MWRKMDDGYIAIGCSIFMKGVMLLGHGNVLEVLEMGSDVDVLICLHPLGSGQGDGLLSQHRIEYFPTMFQILL
jgi:hypothetical protein